MANQEQTTYFARAVTALSTLSGLDAGQIKRRMQQEGYHFNDEQHLRDYDLTDFRGMSVSEGRGGEVFLQTFTRALELGQATEDTLRLSLTHTIVSERLSEDIANAAFRTAIGYDRRTDVGRRVRVLERLASRRQS